MNFISTKGMTNDTAPEGQVLVQYLEPFFGGYTVEFGIGYFDNPNDYTNGCGDGWKLWFNDALIKVTSYCILPSRDERDDPKVSKLSQKEFQETFGSYHPNFGSVGE